VGEFQENKRKQEVAWDTIIGIESLNLVDC
jgi:hypothetical protein